LIDGRAGLWFLAIVPLVAPVGGCFWFTSRSRGDELQAQTEDLTKRVTHLEKQHETDRAEYTSLIQKTEQDVGELQEVLHTATSATGNYVVNMENMREQLAQLEGGLAEMRETLRQRQATFEQNHDSLRDRIEQVAAKVGLDPPLDPTKIPHERGELLTMADDSAHAGKVGNARSLYRAFLDRFPTDPQADNVQLKIGQTYAAEGRYPQALTALNVVVDRYPESDVMGETLYTMADSLFKMRSCNDAITLLQAVIQRYHEADLSKRAHGKLREVQRAKQRGCQP